MTLPRLAPLALLVLLVPRPASAQAPRPGGYLGVYGTPATDLPALPDGRPAPALGLEVQLVTPGSAADAAGLVVGDVLLAIDGEGFDPAGGDVYRQLTTRVREGLHEGDVVQLSVLRRTPEIAMTVDGAPAAPAADLDAALAALDVGHELVVRASRPPRLLSLSATLTARPEERAPVRPVPADEDLEPQLAAQQPAVARFAELAVAHFGLQADEADLRRRLARLAESDDGYRLDAVRFVQRHPYHVLLAAGDVLAGVAPDEPTPDLAHRIIAAAALDRTDLSGLVLAPLPLAASLEQQAQAIERVMADTAALRDAAFADLSADERAFLRDHVGAIADALAADAYLHADADSARRADNLRVLELAGRVHRDALHAAALSWARLADPQWLAALQRDHGHRPGNDAAELVRRPTPWGDILIAGTGNDRHRGEKAAVIVDLGGDDLYSDEVGSTSFDDRPLAAIVDLAGDDSHASTKPCAQACGLGGVALLVDVAGDDRYLGGDWSQGAGVLGAGFLVDLAGDDDYRARRLGQGLGLWGLGFLIDAAGNDTYDGLGFVQGVGLPAGIGVLHDEAGDDRYHAKGGTPTGYGTPGVFDAWSQGCGFGFRGLQSGGLGVLADGGGRDRRIAGNFAQGGGYWFGWGILHDAGRDDDVSIGSRYDQGFSAHQAVGTYVDDGGDDRYVTENGVIAGLAWDESVTAFVDLAGNDLYRAGFFSLGASAHDAVSIFIEGDGDDTYEGAPLGAAGPNDYHGGTSLSLVLELGFGRDLVQGVRPEPGLVLGPGESLVAHLPGALEPQLVPGTFPRVPATDARPPSAAGQ